MADTYTSTLGVILMGIGGDNNTWGTNLNNSVFQIFEDAIANIGTFNVTGGTLDLSTNAPPAGPSLARYRQLVFTGSLASNQTVVVPQLNKMWIVVNGCALNGFTLSMKTPTGTPAVIPLGATSQVATSATGNGIAVSPFNWNQVFMPSGSAAVPSYCFASETNSGWYRAGTQDLRLAVNGSDVLQVTGAGAGTPSVMNLIAGALQVGGTQVIPPGTVQAYDGIELPSGGWLWCDGSAYSRPIANGGSVDTYKNLFNAITKTCTGNTHANTTVDNLSVDVRGKGLDGAFVEGTGIPTGTRIAAGSITASGFTLSQAASSSVVGLSLRILPYGQGDGSTTFNVRDARGRSLFGRDNMNNNAAGRLVGSYNGALALSGTSLPASGGEETHQLTTPEIPAHAHTINEPNSGQGHQHTASDTAGRKVATTDNSQCAPQTGGVGVLGSSGDLDMKNGINTGFQTTGITLNNTGGGGAHNNMPMFGISNMIIKT